MSTKVTFYIARHGKTILNTLGKVQGWSDSPLTHEGAKVAKYLGAGLSDIQFSSAYCSDLRRTHETINIILEHHGQKSVKVVEKTEFREVCFGSYESDPTNNMWKDAALYLQYKSSKDLLRDVFDVKKNITYEQVANVIKKLDELGMAEGFDEVEKRTQKALLEIAKKESKGNEEKNVLIVAHGMCIKFMLQNLGGRDLVTDDLGNASVCKVVFKDGKFKVESMGDMSYVEKGKKMIKMK